MARGRLRHSVPRSQRVSSQPKAQEPKLCQTLDTIHVGTPDPTTQRMRKKDIKRIVHNKQPYHSVGQKGVITWNKKEVPVYRRHDQMAWTIFLEDVLLAFELQLPPLHLQ